MSKVIVTGGTGYIGSKLVEKLIQKKFDVAIIARNSSKFNYLKSVEGKYSTYFCNDSIDNLEEIMKDYQPEIVFHLAGYVTNGNDDCEIENLIYSNIYFGAKLLQAMKNYEVNYFINTGTYWQNYKNEDYNPVNLYAATKEAFDKIIKYYIETSNLKAITLKLFDVYGPNDKRRKLISSLNEYADSNRQLKLSKGEQLIDYIYIDDVIEAYLAAYEHMKKSIFKYEEYGVASGERHSLKDIIKLYENILDKKLNIEFGGKPYREREVMMPWNKYKKLPNWTSRTTLRQGLYKCYFE